MLITTAGSLLSKQAFTPSAKLAFLAQSEDRITRIELALNPNTPIRILKKLDQDKSKPVASAVAENASLPDELRMAFLNRSIPTGVSGFDKAFWYRCRLAGNANNSVSLLKKLAKLGDHAVLCGVASNPNTPVYLLEQLASVGQWGIQKNIARNPNTPATVLKQLADKNDTLLNYAIACNSKAPLSVLERILPEEDAVYVMRRVSEHPNASEKLRNRLAGKIGTEPTGSINEKDNAWVATNKYIAADVLEKWII